MAQDDIDFSRYVLDTLIVPSADDSTVFDTTILARQKVVVSKQIIVEKETIVPPVFSKYQLYAFFSPLALFPQADSSPQALVDERLEVCRYASVGAGMRFDLWENFTAGFDFAYEKVSSKLSVAEKSTYNVYLTDTVPYLVETYYVLEGSDTVQYDIWENRVEDKIVQNDTLYRLQQKNVYRLLSVSVFAGKQFGGEQLSVMPYAFVAHSWLLKKKTSLSSEKYSSFPYKSSARAGFSFGIGCRLQYAPSESFGFEISPELFFYEKKLLSPIISKSVVYRILCGFYVKI